MPYHKGLSLSVVAGGIVLTIAAAWVSQAMGMLTFQDHGVTFYALVVFAFAIMGIVHRFWTISHENEQQRLLEYLHQETSSPDDTLADLSNFRFGVRELAEAVQERIGQLTRRQQTLQRQQRELDIRLRLSEAQREHLESILNSLTDAVIVTDTFNEVVAMNQAAARMFHADPDMALRKPIDQIVPDRALTRLIRDTCESIRQQPIPSLHVEHRMDDGGQQRIYDVFMELVQGNAPAKQSPENNDAGETNTKHPQDDGWTAAAVNQPHEELAYSHALGCGKAGVVTILRDITVEKSAAEMRSDFVSNVSHELRTPLSSIKAYLEMLIDGEARDEQTRAEFYNIIQSETNRLSRLIDNILNLSRIESGLAQPHCERLDLTQVIHEAMDIMTPQARAGRLEMVQRIAEEPVYVHADHDMMMQVLTNLLSNAIKYTPVGGMVTVAMRVDKASRQVCVAVSDTGIGIPQDSFPHLFEKFYRVPSHRQMAKGTGLGLNLVKQIIEHIHGGQLAVESTPDVGTTLTFTLPMAENE